MRSFLVLLTLLSTACDSGILSILGKDPADMLDGFTDDETDAPPESADEVIVESATTGDTASDFDDVARIPAPAVQCVDVGGGLYDRILTAVVPSPDGLDWARVLAPDVLVWRASESCLDDEAPWTTGTEGYTGHHPDGSPGATYTLTVLDTDQPCSVDLPITLAWTAELRDGTHTVYAASGDTEPTCS